MRETELSNKKQNSLIFLCWLVYVVAYLGRYSYSANIKIIGEIFNIGADKTGLVTTMFFFCYGAGQIVNGLLCKRYNKKVMLSLSLIISAILNLVISLGAPFETFKYLWLINGVVQSVLWSSLILVLSENLDDAHLNKSIVVMSTCVPAGTFIIYGASALFSTFASYKLPFLFASISLVTVGALWFTCFSKVTKTKQAIVEEGVKAKETHGKLSPSLIVTICLICFFAVVCNLVKDGLQTWTPDILGAKFTLPDSTSIFLTLLLPLVGVLGATIAVKTTSLVKNYVVVIGLFFLFSGAFMLGVTLLMERTWVVVIMFMAISFCASQGINNVITSIAPLQLREKINAGMLTGILNGCCYVGSTISGYGLGSLVESTGDWMSVFWLLIALCSLSVLISVVYFLVSKLKSTRYKNKKEVNVE